MSALIQFEIKDCQDCPFCDCQRHWTSDSWEHAYDYYCTKKYEKYKIDGKPVNKKIAGYIEWRSEMPEVPDWCPIRVKQNDTKFNNKFVDYVNGKQLITEYNINHQEHNKIQERMDVN